MNALIGYGIGALIILAALTGAYQYVDNHWVTDAGVAEGKRVKQDEWNAANAKAVLEAEAQRAEDEKVAKVEAQKLEVALAKQRRLNRELTEVVNSHIAAAKFAASCKLTPELLNDWNRAAGGGETGETRSVVSNPRGTTPSVGRPVDSGIGLKLPASR